MQDIGRILSMAQPWSRAYPLKMDEEKVDNLLREAVSSAKHFAWVSETDGLVDGVLVGLTGDNLWAQRANCNIVLWLSKAKGAGAELLRKFRGWVTSRRAIKVAGMCPDLDIIDRRVWKLVERIGFVRHGGAYLLYN